MQEFAEAFGTDDAKAGREVSHAVPGHPAGQPVVEAVGEAATSASLARRITRAHDHVVTLFQPFQQAGNLHGIMLPVGVHEYEDLAASRPGTSLDGRAVRSEEPTSELQSLMRTSYAVFCWTK